MPIYENTQTINDQKITIAIEVDKLPRPSGPYEDLRDGYGLQKARDLFGDGLELAQNCATRVVNSIKEIGGAAKPDEFELQFAIKLDTEVGAIIAKSRTEAQLQVTMTWKTNEEKQK